MKLLNYIINAILAVLTLILLEGMMTLGQAFMFEKYNIFAWFVQVLLFTLAILVSIKITEEDKKDK